MIPLFRQLAEISQQPKTQVKISLLRSYNCPIMRDVLLAAFNPAVNYGVGEVTLPGDLPPQGVGEPPTFTDFMQLAQALSKREIVGNTAQEAVGRFAARFPSSLRGMVAALFARKLSIGLAAEGINKAIPGLIPVFGVQLAEIFSAPKMRYPAFASSKLDGMRCLLFVTPTSTAMLSRTGKLITGLPHIVEAFSKAPVGVYDGELLHANGEFISTVSIARRGTAGEQSAAMRFHVFDFVPMDDWANPKLLATDRFALLNKVYANYLAANRNLESWQPVWFVVEHRRITGDSDLERTHAAMVAAGYEGTMVQFDVPYCKRRSANLMKIKDFLDTSGRVVGTRHGRGKFKSCVGALNCIDVHTNVAFDCASGLTDAQRNLPPEWWIGKVIDVKYQERLPSGAPRFPVFLRLRDDLLEE